LALQQAGIPSFDYNPNQVKQAVSGYGAADKVQMQSMVRTLLNLGELPKPDDAADALAVAICHLNTQRTVQMIDEQS
jgi:crossover junction endodeoxyribonuclease RuvC